MEMIGLSSLLTLYIITFYFISAVSSKGSDVKGKPHKTKSATQL